MNKRKLEKRERNRKDKLWRDFCKERDGNKCAVDSECSTGPLHVHHIIPREIKAFRWNTDNGICLCPRHHKYSFQLSAHRASFAFMEWMRLWRFNQYTKLVRLYTQLNESGGKIK